MENNEIKRNITAATLFSGLGGGSLALIWNFIKELLAVDNWPVAKLAFEAYFKDTKYIPFWLTDILALTADDLLRRMLLMAGDLDLLLVSPPCQGFSVAKGKLNPLDPRNFSFLHSIGLIAGIKPKCFIIENVPGMTDARLTPIFNEVKYRFKTQLPDYNMKCFKLCALNYNTPQKRYRLIFIGYHKSLNAVPTPPPSNLAAIENLRIKDIAPEITAIRVGQSKKSIKHNTKIMNTVLASGGTTAIIDGEEHTLTVEHNRKFAGFPKDFILPAEIKEKDAQKLYGNTIPPLFMKAVVKHILSELGDKLGTLPDDELEITA